MTQIDPGIARLDASHAQWVTIKCSTHFAWNVPSSGSALKACRFKCSLLYHKHRSDLAQRGFLNAQNLRIGPIMSGLLPTPAIRQQTKMKMFINQLEQEIKSSLRESKRIEKIEL